MSPRDKARAVNFAQRLIASGQQLLLLWFSSVAVLACAFAASSHAGESPQAASQWHARGVSPRPLVNEELAPPRALRNERPAPATQKNDNGSLLWGTPSRPTKPITAQATQPVPDPFEDRPQLGRPSTSDSFDFDRAPSRTTTPSDPFDFDRAPSRTTTPESLPPSRQGLDPFPGERTPRLNNDMPPALDDLENTGCEGTKKACEELINTLRRRDISAIFFGLQIDGEGGLPPVEGKDYPCECPVPKEDLVPRAWCATTMTWKATGTCHKPLYFEDVQLERYGHSWNPVVQPFMSAAHFFVSVPLLPYNMGVNPPHECVYTLGYYRPGNCAPYMFEAFPISARGMMFEAMAATAFAFWFWPPPH